jgi:hypothetical protein
LLERFLPADSWWPGVVPAQEARWPAVRKRVISPPVSAMITNRGSPLRILFPPAGASSFDGNRYLAAALGTAAMSAARTKNNTYLGARYARLVPRLGKMKAIVALQHSILLAVWHMLTHDTPYQDLGGDYFDKLDPDRAKRRAIAQLHRLGYHVELTHAA